MRESTDTMREVGAAPRAEYDAVIIGSGFGGSMMAHRLVHEGWSVLLLERGEWVPRGPENWAPENICMDTPHYERVAVRGRGRKVGGVRCVGGASVFYGGVSARFRPRDLEVEPDIAPAHLSAWPFDYAELERGYAEAERLLEVRGAVRSGESSAYVAPPAERTPVAVRVAAAAERLGMHPAALPLAIHTWQAGAQRNGRYPCIGCGTCDGFACAIGAKNDLATCVLPPLLAQGLELRTGMAATRLVLERDRVAEVHAVGIERGERYRVRAGVVVLAAGAIGSAQLALASGLDTLLPGGANIGRWLMRHCCGSVYGFFPGGLEGAELFHKQVGVDDFYFGDSDGPHARGKLGHLQQVPTPGVGHARQLLPAFLAARVGPLLRRMSGLLAIAEDQPRPENRITLDRRATDGPGLPLARIHHQYTARDRWARRALTGHAARILREAGARVLYRHYIDTFSHAVGTLRAGTDPRWSAVDASCRFHGLDNLYVADGSFMPTSAGANPSLTIAANALRVGDVIAGRGVPRAATAASGGVRRSATRPEGA